MKFIFIKTLVLAGFLGLGLCGATVPWHVYVGALDESSVTLVWGTLDGRKDNTIGRGAAGKGPAQVRVGSKQIATDQSWLRVDGLEADRAYDYEVRVKGQSVGKGTVRTWPKQAKVLRFFVIGDWGNGSSLQYQLAERMEAERKRMEGEGKPVRFVMSTGDNIYKGGSEDQHWKKKFFVPYESTLKSIPFYAVLGNHDGNESESAADLPAYLDNFFAPQGEMKRWYGFRFANFVDFFALDSTTNQYPGAAAPLYGVGGEQSVWLQKELQRERAPWRIAYMHHPMFTAGPRHVAMREKLQHWMDAFAAGGVSAVFAGHEHNLQFSERNAATQGMQFVVTGAGGELRKGNVTARMKSRNIALWSAQVHFLVVEILGDEMTIRTVGLGPAVEALKVPRR
jgi:tartrate-resistant acid phosphatase type 5